MNNDDGNLYNVTKRHRYLWNWKRRLIVDYSRDLRGVMHNGAITLAVAPVNCDGEWWGGAVLEHQTVRVKDLAGLLLSSDSLAIDCYLIYHWPVLSGWWEANRPAQSSGHGCLLQICAGTIQQGLNLFVDVIFPSSLDPLQENVLDQAPNTKTLNCCARTASKLISG